MFVGVDYLQLTKGELEENSLPDEKLEQLNNVFHIFTTIVHEFGGETRDLLFDDKGCIYIAVFGAHNKIELPELKCMKAALQVSNTYKSVKIGIDVGKCFTGSKVFCATAVIVNLGMCGTKERHDFVVMGHEVNMAARFMLGIFFKIHGLYCHSEYRSQSWTSDRKP